MVGRDIMKARVTVTLKPGVLDPQGKAIEGALKSLGIAGIASVRQGKVFDIELEGTDRARGGGGAQGRGRQAARQHGDRELPGRSCGMRRRARACALMADALHLRGCDVQLGCMAQASDCARRSRGRSRVVTAHDQTPLKLGSVRVTTLAARAGKMARAAIAKRPQRRPLRCRPLACADRLPSVRGRKSPTRHPEPKALEKFAKVDLLKSIRAGDAARETMSDGTENGRNADARRQRT